MEGFLEGNVTDQVVRIDPALLSPEDQRKLQALRLSEAALQLAWLAESYDKPRRYPSDVLLKGLEAEFPYIDRSLDLEPVWAASRAYLEDEALEILPQELIDRLMVVIKGAGRSLNTPELLLRLTEVITASQVMDAEDAGSTAAGVLHRASSVLRLERASTLRESLAPLFSPNLRDQKDFRKRADGVLWTLWTEQPVFFASRVTSIPTIARASISTTPVRIESSGFPDLVRRLDDLVYLSQIQSLILASLVVLALVSLTQRSFRRGLISLLSVLVPLGYILGVMGWTQIPLDFGTVLFSALIIGLGVDGSIHFLHHYHRLQLRGIHGEEAIRRTMGHVGKAILTANATTCCGFLIMLFSSTSVLRNFGIVNSLAIFLVTASLLTFLPALVTLFHMDNSREQESGIRGQGS
jgi:hypothetical protein